MKTRHYVMNNFNSSGLRDIVEKKVLIGPLTSLEKYAELLGSEFIKIDIY